MVLTGLPLPGMRDAITFPVAPQPWEELRPFGVVWFGGGGERHRLSGGCVDKDGPLVDCGRDMMPYGYGINLVLAGRGTYCDPDGTVHDLRPGSIFQRIHGVGPITVQILGGGWTECYVSSGRETLQHMQGLGFALPQPVLHLPDPETISARFAQLFQAMEGVGDEAVRRVWVRYQSLLMEIADQLDESDSEDPLERVLQQARQRLESRLGEPLDLQALAIELGLGYEHFRKIFRQRFGVAPNAYRVRRRLDRACMLLLDHSRSVTQVADLLGYTDAFAFSNQFRRHYDVSPSEYRRGH